MATKKDLVEAHAYSRRRLVTAFLSGAPGGREVEPARPGRTIVGGVALAVLLVAAAAIASVLASKTEEDWNKVGLVVSREEAAPYVILEDRDDPELVPVLNITSAQLILGADVEPTYVEQDVIEEQTPGETIGIFGAPQTLPRPSRFIEDGWTACTGDEHGVMLGLRSGADVEPLADGGIVVSNQGRDYVVARSGELADHPRATLYPLPDDPNVDAMLNELGLRERAEAMEVPEDWLQLFPAGGELGWSSFGIIGPGTKPTVDAASYPPGRPGRRLLGRRRRGPGDHRPGPDAAVAVRAARLPVQPGPEEEPDEARPPARPARRVVAGDRAGAAHLHGCQVAGLDPRAAHRRPLRAARDRPGRRARRRARAGPRRHDRRRGPRPAAWSTTRSRTAAAPS